MFWLRFEPTKCLPNNCGCEAIVDTFVRQPVNFWSSFSYIVVAFFFYRSLKNNNAKSKFWFLICLLIGTSSLFGHMSFIQFSMAMDFASIILALIFFALWDIFDEKNLKLSSKILTLLAIYLSTLFMMYQMGKNAKIGSGIVVFCFTLYDILNRRHQHYLKSLNFKKSFGIFFISFLFFVLDELKILCNPNSLFQFHSLWHLGSSCSLYFYGRWRFEGNS